jgi:SAM-dependent methyltransferase
MRLDRLIGNSLAAIVVSASTLFGLPATAQQYGDEKYQPSVGQHGKDVIWVPTPDDLVVRMLETAKVTANDLVYDLGAGDGKIPIQAARQFGARAVGIEYNPDMAALAKRNAARAGVADKVTIIHGDIFKEDFTKATVVTLYLLPDLNLRLKPILLKMKPGTRVVSHSFNMGVWEPDETIVGANSYYGYFWIVPARVEGQWTLNGLAAGNAQLKITQKFQKFDGVMTIAGKDYPITNGRLKGAEMSFEYRDASNKPQQVVAAVDGNQLSGELIGDTRARISGQRR